MTRRELNPTLSLLTFCGCAILVVSACSPNSSTQSGGGDSTTNSPGDGGGGGTSGNGGSGGGVGGSPSVGGSGGKPGGGGNGAGATEMGGAGSGGDGSGGAGGARARTDGPCDIYEAAGKPCAVAYSTVRTLRRGYTGPLYQIRVGSSPYNTGGERVTNPEVPWDGSGDNPSETVPEPGELIDVRQTADGIADVQEQKSRCQAPTICTVSLLYDQSGNGTHLQVAGGSGPFVGEFGALDNFETVMDDQAHITVGGRGVYSLRMDARQGYRTDEVGAGMPKNLESQEIYLLTDGTRFGTKCCWEFGNVPTRPITFSIGTTLFFGEAFWGRGETPPGAPWFGLSYNSGVYMGGSEVGDPGWGGVNATAEQRPPNQDNPSMAGVPFALGFLKTNEGPDYEYALRMADVSSASDVQTAYRGAHPALSFTFAPLDNRGSVILGLDANHANNSFGTFYEGAIVAGYPDDATELAVMKNIQAAGYGEQVRFP